LAALIVGAVSIAFAPIFAKLAMGPGGIGSTAAALWRVSLAFPVFLGAWLWQQRYRRPPPSPIPLAPVPSARTVGWLLLPGVLFAGDMFVWHASFDHTSAASATLLANLQVVIMGFVGWLLYEERLNASFMSGAGLAFGGVALLVWANQDAGGERTLFGDALAMLTACFYGAYLLTVKRLRQRHSVLGIMTVASIASSCVLLPLTLWSSQPAIPTLPRTWLYVIALALVAHCVGQGLIAFALARLPASSSGVTLLAQPVGAAILGWLLLGERLNPTQITAGAAVVLGIWLAWRASR
jgi:drug/metabolite transporter (DMT)-like permease